MFIIDFEVSPEDGEALIKVIGRFQSWIDEQAGTLTMLQQQRKLGTSSGAKVMTPFVQQVVGDEQGFITQPTALGDSLAKAKEGIVSVMDNYKRTEDAIADSLKSIDG